MNVVNISNWSEQLWFHTGGTRDKKLLKNPDGDLYYFKTSILKPGKDYKYEFWSEIIAGQLCGELGFDILKYVPSIHNDTLGCLSLSMIQPNEERLTEGRQFLRAISPEFDPEINELRKLYTYQLIVKTLDEFDLKDFLGKIHDMIIMDAIIGNSDRHQDNWAFISRYSGENNFVAELERKGLTYYMSWLFIKIAKLFVKNTKQMSTKAIIDLYPYLDTDSLIRFSPIYDNGCSLGREMNDQKIHSLLSDEKLLENYANRGKSEIHWNNRKISHFKLLENIISEQPNVGLQIKTKIEQFDATNFRTILHNLDSQVPNNFSDFKLSQIRKDFIEKIISLRINKLYQLIAKQV